MNICSGEFKTDRIDELEKNDFFPLVSIGGDDMGKDGIDGGDLRGGEMEYLEDDFLLLKAEGISIGEEYNNLATGIGESGPESDL